MVKNIDKYINKIFDDEEIFDFTVTIADKLVDYQHTSNAFPAYYGSFWSDEKEREPNSAETGRIVESLFLLNSTKYRDSAELGMKWLNPVKILLFLIRVH